MPTVQTIYGPINALPSLEYFSDGNVRSCISHTESHLHTPYGELIPQFTANTFRKRQLPTVSFHPNGMIRNLPLEEQTEVHTPLGKIPAELITLYEDGALKRIFPLNGTLSGFWSQEDEAQLAEPLLLNTPVGPIETNVLSLYFGPKGNIKSLTLWPDTQIQVPFQGTTLPVRIGVSFYNDGSIKSVEPASALSITTPLGELLAYDPDAVGITGDSNSLRFSQSGEVVGLRSVSHAFTLQREGQAPQRVEPPIRYSPCDGESREPAPLQVTFDKGHVFFDADGMKPVSAPLEDVTVSRFILPFVLLGPACTMGSAIM
ncbi:MAG: hypothetical protein ACNI3A_00975 [Desulfovibrio sp.]|uniref:hypothetical protein n=1 Tax=Desulfovibrio sp. 7SRBS1 TaxID=3378064 RepID=UPI003B3D1DC5